MTRMVKSMVWTVNWPIYALAMQDGEAGVSDVPVMPRCRKTPPEIELLRLFKQSGMVKEKRTISVSRYCLTCDKEVNDEGVSEVSPRRKDDM